MLSPRQVIDDIRRSEYGIGLPADPETQAVISNIRSQLDRALKLLSQELYAAEIHFVLELIQNAEDNHYDPGDEPTLTFILTDDTILVQNNEVGFTEENVRSLCNVAKSTKVKRLGYIGEKGIGFKSVFKVTEEPYVCSNGYSFSLPLRDEETGLGYVIPVWRDAVPPGVEPAVTNVLLPLTAKGRQEVSKVAQVEARLLLFLKRLRRIEVRDETGTCTKWICREDRGDCVRIDSSSGTEHWKVVRRSLAVPPGIAEEKRQDVPAVDVVLAFPVADDGVAEGSLECPVYSFLPVRSCGFRFAIQADFILASSREDILPDRAWNQWLRDSIPSLFMEAVERFKADPALRTSFLSFVPLANQISDGFFKDLPQAIVELLRHSPCILTASGKWAKPVEVLTVTDAWRAHVSNEDVERKLGKEFIDPAFHPGLPLLKVLGVKPFSLPELMTCLKDTEWLAAKGDQWLVRVLAHLNTAGLPKEAGDALRMLDLVPLEDGSFSSTAKGKIFLPLSKRTSYGFETGLRVVRKSLFDGSGAPVIDAARSFLKGTLGVRSADAVEIIKEYVLPAFESTDDNANWKRKDDGFRHGSVEYIKDHFADCEKSAGLVDRLRRSLWIKFVHPNGNVYTRLNELYLPRTYGNKNRLEILFKGLDSIKFVDPAYLQHSLARHKKPGLKEDELAKAEKKLASNWGEFFSKLGVESTLRVNAPPSADSPEAVKSDDLERLIQTQDATRLATALRLLDQNWDRYRPLLEFERYTEVRGKRYSHGTSATTFSRQIRQSGWIPTRQHGLCQPAAVCLDTLENRDLLGEHVPYLNVELKNTGFVADLGIRIRPAVSAVLDCLENLSAGQVSDTPRFRRLYTYLDQAFQADSEAIASAFRDQPLIHVPGNPARFRKSSEVFWKDASDLFGGSRVYLVNHWKELKEFFVTKLEVPLTPSPQDYVDLLKELSEQTTLTLRDEGTVWQVYKIIDRHLAEAETDDDGPGEWWQDFLESELFWTDRRAFWPHDGNILVNDRDEYYELFKGRPDIGFLNIPPNQYPSASRLIAKAKLPMLSESVRVVSVSPDNPRPEPTMTALIREATPFLIRYLFFREYDLYSKLEESRILQQLPSTSVQVCDALSVTLELCGGRVTVKQDVAADGLSILVQRDALDPQDRVSVILSDILGNPRGLSSFVGLLLARKGRESMERLMTAQRIPPMPPAETAFDPESGPPAEDLREEELVFGVELHNKREPDATSETDLGGSGQVGDEWAESPPADTKCERSGSEPKPTLVEPDAAERLSDGTPESNGKSRDPVGTGRGHSVTPSSSSGSPTAESPRSTSESSPAGPTALAGRRGDTTPNDAPGAVAPTRGSTSQAQRGEDPDRPTPDGPARNWFRVLARPADDGSSTGDGNPPPKDDEARELVLRYERRRGRNATAASVNQAGYDIASEDSHRGVRRLIEVKGLQQRWLGDATVTMTGAQFDAARREPPPGCEYWLYVVDGVGTDSPNVYPILRPAAKVERVYLQAQDWACEADQADRNRLADELVAGLGLPIVEFGDIARLNPAAPFVTRYPKKDLSDVVTAGGFLRCLPLEPGAGLPPRGSLVMFMPSQLPQAGLDGNPVVGEFRWSPRQSPEGEPLHVDVTVRPKTADPDAKPLTERIPTANWSGFRPFAVCEAVTES